MKPKTTTVEKPVSLLKKILLDHCDRDTMATVLASVLLDLHRTANIDLLSEEEEYKLGERMEFNCRKVEELLRSDPSEVVAFGVMEM